MVNRLFFILLILLFSGCSKKILVQSDYINPTDFSKYRTFTFNDEKADANFTFNEANQERVRNAVTMEMNKRQFIQSELADLVVNVQGSIEMIRETGTSFDPYPFYGRWDPRFYPYNDVRPRDENESVIIINVKEEHSGKLLWQGVATGDFQQKKKHIELVILETVEQIFNEFPYNPQSAGQVSEK